MTSIQPIEWLISVSIRSLLFWKRWLLHWPSNSNDVKSWDVSCYWGGCGGYEGKSIQTTLLLWYKFLAFSSIFWNHLQDIMCINLYGILWFVTLDDENLLQLNKCCYHLVLKNIYSPAFFNLLLTSDLTGVSLPSYIWVFPPSWMKLFLTW